MKKFIRFIPLLAGIMIICSLAYGLLLSNLWQLMPEFNQLNRIFAVPLYVQIALFLFVSLFLILILTIKRVIPLSFLLLVCVFLTILSWYQVNVSNSTNSLTVAIYPFYEKKIRLEDLKKIAIKENRLFVTTLSDTFAIRTGFYPAGIPKDKLQQYLFSLGSCTRMADNKCVEINFGW